MQPWWYGASSASQNNAGSPSIPVLDFPTQRALPECRVDPRNWKTFVRGSLCSHSLSGSIGGDGKLAVNLSQCCPGTRQSHSARTRTRTRWSDVSSLNFGHCALIAGAEGLLLPALLGLPTHVHRCDKSEQKHPSRRESQTQPCHLRGGLPVAAKFVQ